MRGLGAHVPLTQGQAGLAAFKGLAQDELAEAVKQDNKDDLKLGVGSFILFLLMAEEKSQRTLSAQ